VDSHTSLHAAAAKRLLIIPTWRVEGDKTLFKNGWPNGIRTRNNKLPQAWIYR